jgi:LuxR family transcriptional activator of bioluminescence operon
MDIAKFISMFDAVGSFSELKDSLDSLVHAIEAEGDFKACFVQMSFKSLEVPLIFLHNRFPIEWQYVYNKKRYHSIDPSWSHARKSLLPFFWSDLRHLSDIETSMVEDAKRHGLCSGVLIPFHGRSGYSLLWIMSALEHSQVKDQLELFKQETYAILPHIFEATSQIALSGLPILTKRESECLYWAAEGRNTEAIGRRLFVSPSTVEKHITHAVTKLDAMNRSHAIRIARDLGLLMAREDTFSYSIRTD